MNNNSPDYLSYKKSKMNNKVVMNKKSSKFKISAWIFLITFALIFAFVVQVVRKYSTKIDIEYGRNQSELSSYENQDVFSDSNTDNRKRKIDNRLRQIQLEENAPSESKISKSDKKADEVIDKAHFDKIINTPLPETKTKPQPVSAPTPSASASAPTPALSAPMPNLATNVQQQSAVSAQITADTKDGEIVYSKVLIGKYPTFDKAREAQSSVRSLNQGATPFVRKVGDIYSLQVGSFESLNAARNIAAKYRAEKYDVWIYQQ